MPMYERKEVALMCLLMLATGLYVGYTMALKDHSDEEERETVSGTS